MLLTCPLKFLVGEGNPRGTGREDWKPVLQQENSCYIFFVCRWAWKRKWMNSGKLMDPRKMRRRRRPDFFRKREGNACFLRVSEWFLTQNDLQSRYRKLGCWDTECRRPSEGRQSGSAACPLQRPSRSTQTFGNYINPTPIYHALGQTTSPRRRQPHIGHGRQYWRLTLSQFYDVGLVWSNNVVSVSGDKVTIFW